MFSSFLYNNKTIPSLGMCLLMYLGNIWWLLHPLQYWNMWDFLQLSYCSVVLIWYDDMMWYSSRYFKEILPTWSMHHVQFPSYNWMLIQSKSTSRHTDEQDGLIIDHDHSIIQSFNHLFIQACMHSFTVFFLIYI